MITQSITIRSIDGSDAAFEDAVIRSQFLLERVNGFVSINVEKYIGGFSQYRIQIVWHKLENYSDNFVKSEHFRQWHGLLSAYIAEPMQSEFLKSIVRYTKGEICIDT